MGSHCPASGARRPSSCSCQTHCGLAGMRNVTVPIAHLQSDRNNNHLSGEQFPPSAASASALRVKVMSALPQKADMQCKSLCPLRAKSGHSAAFLNCRVDAATYAIGRVEGQEK